MATLCAGNDCQALRFSKFTNLDDLSGTHGIDCDRLLNKAVLTCFNTGLEVHWAEVWWRRHDHNFGIRIRDNLIRSESEMSLLDRQPKLLNRPIDLVFKSVRNCDDFDLNAEQLSGFLEIVERSSAAPPTADQADLNFAGIDTARSLSTQYIKCGNCCGRKCCGFNKIATCKIVHIDGIMLFFNGVNIFSDRLTGCPQQTAGDHLHILILQHRFVVMPDRGGKYASLVGAEFIDPDVGMHLTGLV